MVDFDGSTMQVNMTYMDGMVKKTYSFGYHWLPTEPNLSQLPRQAGSGSGAFFAANDAARNQYLGRLFLGT